MPFAPRLTNRNEHQTSEKEEKEKIGGEKLNEESWVFYDIGRFEIFCLVSIAFAKTSESQTDGNLALQHLKARCLKNAAYHLRKYRMAGVDPN